MNTVVLLNYQRDIPVLNSKPEGELIELVEILTRNGYAYNPHDLTFYNFQLSDVLKGSELNVMTPDVLNVRIELAEDRIKKTNNGQTLTEEQGKKILSITFKNNESRSLFRLKVLSGLLGGILILIAIVVFFVAKNTGNDLYLKAAAALNFAGVASMYYYFIKNKLYELKEHMGSFLDPIWTKYKGLFFLLIALSCCFLYYQMFKLLDSFWMPILVIYAVTRLVRFYTIKELTNEYFYNNPPDWRVMPNKDY